MDDSTIPAELLALKPRKPKEDECCGQGCRVCVLDLYESELKIWKQQCLRAASSTVSTGERLSPDEYSLLKLISITKLSDDTSIYRFALPNGDSSFSLKPGQHLMLRAIVNGGCISRPYTPLPNDNDHTGFFEVLIKLYPNGVMSSHVAQWCVGSEAQWRGPHGDVISLSHLLTSGSENTIVFLIAAGTGITPMLTVLSTLTRNEDCLARIRLIFCCGDEKAAQPTAIIDRYRAFWNVTVLYCYSNVISGSPVRYGDEVHYGKLDESLLKKEFLSMTTSSNPNGVSRKICAFISGTHEFDKRFANFMETFQKTQVSYHVF